MICSDKSFIYLTSATYPATFLRLTRMAVERPSPHRPQLFRRTRQDDLRGHHNSLQPKSQWISKPYAYMSSLYEVSIYKQILL